MKGKKDKGKSRVISMIRGRMEGMYIILVVLTALMALTIFSGMLFGRKIALVSFWLTAFIVSMYVLIKSADYFTSYSEKLGIALGVPQFIIGMTVVALGTSLPELITASFAVVRGATEFVAGNVVGSNIANILLVLGLTAIITRKLRINWDIMGQDVPLLFGSALLLIIIMIDGSITFFEGMIMLLLFFAYIAYTIFSNNSHSTGRHEKLSPLYPVIIILSGAGVYLGANYTIESVVSLSSLLGFADTSVIALSAVAIGTSLPELSVSISAARKGNYEMVVGNVVGSNIFNSTLVIGVPSLVASLAVPSTTFIAAVAFMGGATLLFIFSIMDRKILMFEGIVFVLAYILFLGTLFGLV
ncbi:MAG: calcium/sodium antiporter [Candidatus Woesearchaeota archaeon]